MNLHHSRLSREKPPAGRAFTFVEVIIACGLVAAITGILISLLINYRRGFNKGEESAVLLQEAAIFMATLRNDLINAVIESQPKPQEWRNVITVIPQSLSFHIHVDDLGHLDRVVYEYEPDEAGGNIKRIEGGSKMKTLVNGRIASLSWFLGSDIVGTKPGFRGIRQLWLDLDCLFVGRAQPGLKSPELKIRTKMFPARLIKQLN